MAKYKIVNNITDKQWYNFLKKHPHDNPFQTPEMLKALKISKLYDYIFIALLDEKDDVQALLLAQLQKDYSGILGQFTARAIIWGGPLILNDDSDIANKLLSEYNKIASSKAIYSQIRNLWDTKQYKIAFTNSGYNYDEHLNILVDLTVDEDTLWKSVKKSRKEGIRKARRNDLIFEVKTDKDSIPIFYELLKNTFDSVKKPFPKIDFFHNLQKTYSKDKLKFFTLRKDDKVILSLLAFTYNKWISAYYIGTNREHQYFVMRPVDLLYWEVLKWGAENGYKIFDWLGAGKPNVEYGVRKFKLQYGGNLVEYGRYEIIHKKFLMNIGKMGLKLWQRLK